MTNQRPARRFLAVLILTVGFGSSLSAAEFHVSPTGKDSNPGTADKPFLTLEAARDAVRQAASGDGATVWLHEGRYFRAATFSLEQQDSGKPDKPIVYKAMPGAEVILDGGRLIEPTAFAKVQDTAILDRMLPEVRDKVFQLDLKALGITEYGEFGPRGFGRRGFPAPTELFINGEPMHIARWPNPGEPLIPLGEVLDKGSIARDGDKDNRPGVFRYETERAQRWTKAPELYITGYFAYGFAEDTVQVSRIDTENGTFTTVQPHIYGYGNGSQKSLWKWYAINLLEEIDLPGEYYLDRASGMLYLYPPCALDKARIQISLFDDLFVSMKDASHIRIENIILENGRGRGIKMAYCTGNVVAGCTIRNLGWGGISFSGTGNTILSCDLYNLGSTGISMSGGDRKTLTPGGNAVRNCDIHHLNRWSHNYCPCVAIGGVGNIIEHNHLHHCPGQAVTLSGNDHRIEYNRMGHVNGEMSDQGAIYMGRNPSQTGNLFRYNYFHHCATTHVGSYGNSGIFIDDGDSGQRIFGNVFYKTGSNGGCEVPWRAIQRVHQQRGRRLQENRQISALDSRALEEIPAGSRQAEEDASGCEHPGAALLDPLSEVGQDLRMALHPGKPCRGTQLLPLRRTIRSSSTARTRISAFATWPPSRAKVPGFEPIPFENIGLYADDYRQTVP